MASSCLKGLYGVADLSERRRDSSFKSEKRPEVPDISDGRCANRGGRNRSFPMAHS